jgi:hypothetical protein
MDSSETEKYKDLDREANDFTADMTPEKKEQFESFEPKTVNEDNDWAN